MPEILRTPIEPAYYRAVPYRQRVAGGSTTSFIELPYNYLIGGFEYSKELLASVRNGYFGLYTDTKSRALSDYPTAQHNSPNASMLNANMLHAGLLGYFGGSFQVVSSLNNYTDTSVLQYRAVVGGTIGRRPRPMSVIRDIDDSSIVYAVMSGPNRNQFFGVAKINTTTREVIWRQTDEETADAVPGSFTTGNPAPGLMGWTALPVEYLYQNATSLYFLYGGPRNRNQGSAPSSVYIYSVSKNTGSITEIAYFDLYTVGVASQAGGWIGYKFLGLVDQHTFLIELQQMSTMAENSTFPNNSISPSSNTRCLYKALVSYDLNDYQGTVLWVSDPYIPPMAAPDSTTNYYPHMYPVTGSLVLSDLDDSVFIPIAFQATWPYGYAEVVAQVYMNPDHTAVLDSKILPVVGSTGGWQTVSVGGTQIINAGYDGASAYAGLLTCMNYYYGEFTVNSASPIPYYEITINRFSDMFEGKGMTAAVHGGSTRSVLPYARPRVSSYDHLTTKRTEPVLRIHALSPEGKPRKTILPCGEDIIGQGYTAGAHDDTTAIATQYLYAGPSGVAHPWGVIVSYEGFVKSSSASYFGSMVNCYGLTPRNQGYPMTYGDKISPLHPDYNLANCYWTGTLPGCSYTLRRSGPDLQDCAIYLNDDIFPIYAVSYSINPNPVRPECAPISWYVEAHDVATGEWIEVDRQENVALSFPPLFRTGDYTGTSPYVVNNSNGYAEFRQYRNYFLLEGMRTKCPQGAHAFRITFTDSANGTSVVVGSWMIQEEPWPWKQAQVPESIYYNSANKAYAYSTAGTSSNTAYVYAGVEKSITTWKSATSNQVTPPVALSIVGPRTCAHVPPFYNDNNSYQVRPFFWNGTALYSSASALSNAVYLNNIFTRPIEVIGIQFTMMGLREKPSAGYGSAVPNGVTITASLDNTNWVTIANIPAARLPGLASSYVSPNKVWSKTYLYEFDAPVEYRYFRVTCNGSALGSNLDSSGKRMWVIQNFSVLQKRDPEFAKSAIPMQSLLDKHYFNNARSDVNYNDTALFYKPAEWKNTSFWDPWLTHHPSTYGTTPTGFTWGGFDAHGTLNCGYSASGFLASGVAPTQDVICSAGYITSEQSVTLMASWQGMLSRMAKFGRDGLRPLSDYAANGTFTEPDQRFHKAIYADRIKIAAYSFIRTNYKAASVGAPFRWKVYGSVDGQDWTLIDDREKLSWSSVETVVEFKVANPGWYVYYKWEFLETSDGGLNLLSIDTFITGIDADNPYIHTIIPRNGTVKYASSIEVEAGTVVRNSFNHGNVAWTRTAKAVSVAYDSTGLASFIVDQGVPIYTQSMTLALNASMEDEECPKHVKIEGSTDKTTWATVYEEQNMTWSLDNLYRNQVALSTPGTYRYLRVTFYKPQVSWEELTEYWLLNTKSTPFATASDQSLFKIKSGQCLVHTASALFRPVANLWLSNSSLASVQPQVIQVQKLNPISQQMEVTRNIAAPDNSNILGSVLDSGKNIWYWINTASNAASAHNPLEVTGEPDGYCALCVHSSYSAETVHVKFQDSVAAYDGSPLLLRLSAWVENPMAEGANNKVAGEIKLTLTGGGAKFVTNGEDTITINTVAGAETELEFTASGPDRVSVTAVLLK